MEASSDVPDLPPAERTDFQVHAYRWESFTLGSLTQWLVKDRLAWQFVHIPTYTSGQIHTGTLPTLPKRGSPTPECQLFCSMVSGTGFLIWIKLKDACDPSSKGGTESPWHDVAIEIHTISPWILLINFKNPCPWHEEVSISLESISLLHCEGKAIMYMQYRWRRWVRGPTMQPMANNC